MTRFLLLSFFLNCTSTGFTQIINQRIDKYVVNNSIDTFMVYSLQCSTDFMYVDSCKWYEPNYLIWQQKGKFFLKKFEYCKTNKTLPIAKNNPLTFYLNNKKSIDSEKILQPTYSEIRKNKNRIDTLIVTETIDHYCSHRFQLPLTLKPKYKYANSYYLEFKTFDNGKKNIYYEYNQQTKFKKLIDLTTDLIKEIENSKTSKRQ